MYLLQVSVSMFDGEEGGQDAAAIEAAASRAAEAAEAAEADDAPGNVTPEGEP